MKNIFFLLLTSSLFFLSCKKDSETQLRHDGDNFSAPEIPAGTHIAAARFPSNIIDNYIGRTLDEVEFYIQAAPADCIIEIYVGGTSSAPVYSKNVQNTITSNSWNSHVLDTPVTIANDDIWLAVKVVHNSAIRSIGCDEGPARSNGDWILPDGETDWVTFREQTNNAVNINWNIRGVLSEE